MPTPPFIDSIQRELASLEADLASDPRVRKIKTLKMVLNEYSEPDIVRSPTGEPLSAVHKLSGQPRLETKRGRIHNVVHNVLSSKGRTHRRDLLGILQKTGLLIVDKDPMTTLAIYLSDFKDFRSVGGGFWELALAETTEAPADAEASKSSEPGPETLFRETAARDR
jgi:hypothetical protein